MTTNTQQPIAIIGMAGRFPGAANIDQLWENLKNGVESIRPFTPQELAAAGVTAEQLTAAGYVNAGAVMDGPDKFDAAFFGMTPREAQLIDPQHRILLECAWSTLEHAGYNPRANEAPIGVFGGVAANTYYLHNVSTQTELLARAGGYANLIAREREYAITRVAFKLNLTGPAVAVNTACSTSGVAIHLASQSLRNNECRIALAGGARLKIPFAGYEYVQDGILSPDGHCRAFSADAAGTVVGNGVAMVALKRLDHALEDGDTIHAVIIGSAINNDGNAKVGYTAPSVNGQTNAIHAALQNADIDPETVGYIETHGTGTSLGDPIEIASLTKAYRRFTEETGYCAIGSLKTNLGHLDAAAGVTSVIKSVLAMQHGLIPPSLNFSDPNPQIDFDNSPFYVADEAIEWESYGEPRRAGISMFGLGGTNAHLIIEETPQPPAISPEVGDQLLTISATTSSALEQAVHNLADHLEENPTVDLGNAAYTLQFGRNAFPHRHAISANRRNATDRLRASIKRTTGRPATVDGVAFMFAGGGAQYLSMAQGLYKTETVFRDAVDRCADLLQPTLNLDIRDVIYLQSAAETDFTQPSIALPALFSIQYAQAQQWMVWGIEPAAMIGHSMGEYTAACLAGVFSLEAALEIVALRGRLFETLSEGAMLSVPMGAQEVHPMLNGHLDLAAVNRPNSSVVAGEVADIEKLQNMLETQSINSRRLRIAVAAHSRLVDPILDEFNAYLQTVTFSTPTRRFVSNVTGEWADVDLVTTPNYWVRHLRETVRFSEGVSTLMQEPNIALLEVGPGQVLSTLARQHPARTKDRPILASLRHPRETTPDRQFMLDSLGKLWQLGLPVKWEALHTDKPRRRIPLPTYPFERKRFWIDRLEPSDPTFVERPPVERAAQPVPPLVPPMNPVTVQPALPPVEQTVESVQQVNTPVERTVESVSVMQEERTRQSVQQVIAPVKRIVESVQKVSPRDWVIGQILEIIQDLTGYLPDEIDPYATFLELGFDSLLLTQANTAFTKAFKVKITFRQLFEDAPGVAALADFVVAQLPVSFVVPGGATQQMQMQPVSVQQVQLTQTTPILATTAAEAAALTRNPQPAAGALPKKDKSPWKPLDTTSKTAVSGRQQRAIDLLIGRLNERHKTSKVLTAENRPNLADPRTVAGFRRQWKEIVYPLHVTHSEGSKVIDVDGNELIDLVMGFGVSMFGHKPPFLMKALHEQLDRGIEIGPQTPLAGEAAKLVCELTGMERAAFSNTGSEAVLATMRTARTVSGRMKIATFVGDYHGIFDEVLARRVGAPGRERVIPRAPGISKKKMQDIMLLDYGDPKSIETIIANAEDLAAVLVEPVQSRNPTFQPREFLHKLREVTEKYGIALIFDEMITGFRATQQGAQGHFGVQADIASYGKAVAGGMPIGVVAGKAKYMDALDGGQWQYGDDSVPEVGVTWFAGTFVRHPLAMAAVKASLTHMKEQGPALQANLNAKTARVAAEFNAFCAQLKAPVRLEHFASWVLVTLNGHQEFESMFYQYLRYHNIHITEGRPAFISTAHSEDDLQKIVWAFKRSAAAMVVAELFEGDANVAKRAYPDLYEVIGADEQWRQSIAPSEAQTELWLAAQQSEAANCVYNIPARVHLRGKLDVKRLQNAIQQLVNRHDGLRTTFSANGTQLIITPEWTIDVPFNNLSRLHPSEREIELFRLSEAEARTPFDLVNGPLVRARIIKLAADDHLLFLTGHHIIVDGWSSGVALREIGQFYGQGNSGRLPAPMQIGDFVEWQAKQPNTESYQAARTYWHKQFETPAPYFELPGDRPRPALKTFATNRIDATVGADLLKTLRKVGAKQGTTLFATLLAGFKSLLYRLSGQDDITLAVASAWQPLAGGDDLIADGVNLLPMRNQIDPDLSFNDFLKQVRNTVLDGFEHQEYVYGMLLRELKLPRDLSRNPLVSVFFNLDPAVGELNYGEGLSAELGANIRRFENFDIFFNIVILAEGGLRMECTYNTALYDDATIERWHAAYVTLLTRATEAPQTSVGDLPLLSAETQQTLSTWNDTAADYPDSTTVHALFDAQAAQTPEQTALIVGEKTLTYRELEQQSNQLANYLILNGVTVNTPVGVMLKRSFETMIALLALSKVGGVAVPLDPAYPSPRLDAMSADANLSLVLTQAAFAHLLPNVRKIQLDKVWASVVACGETAPESKTTADSPLYVIYTSGSTGKPKGVVGHHRGLLNRCHWQWNTYPFADGEVCVQKTTLNFVDSLAEMWSPLLQGVPSVLISAETVKNLPQFINTLAEHKVQRLLLVPSLLQLLLTQHANLAQQLPNLTLWTVSGERLSRELAAQFERVLPHAALLNFYGMSEAMADVSYYDSRWAIDAERVPIGRPIQNMQIHLLDANQRPVPIGMAAEVYVGGVGLAAGYLNQSELTAKRFVSHPSEPNVKLYRTGDVARWLPSGMLDYVGRTDQQVKISGVRVELGAVEAHLRAHRQVQEAVVIAEADRLLAYTVGDATTETLRAHCKTQLPTMMRPSAFVQLDALPLLPNGKVDRAGLKGLVSAENTPTRAATPTKPRNALEQHLVQLWQETLNIRPIGVHDDFFDLGGHSLKAMSMLPQMSRLAGKQLPLMVLFQAPTIAQLAEVIRKESATQPAWTSLVPLKPEGDKTPFFYITAYLESMLAYKQFSRHFDADRPLYGIQAQGVDGLRPIHKSLPEMAAHYIREIKTVQPEGPYLIGGHCAGSWVGYEMICQLQERGDEVAFFGVTDGPPPHVHPSKMNFLMRSFGRAGHYFKEQRLWSAIEWQYRLRMESRKECLMGDAASQKIAHVRQQYVQAMRAYRETMTPRYKGAIHLFRSSEFAGFRDKAIQLRWADLGSQPIQIETVHSIHAALLNEPNVAKLAKSIGQALDKVDL